MPKQAVKRRSTRMVVTQELLAQPGMTLTKAADIQGVSRQTIYRDMSFIDQERIQQQLSVYRQRFEDKLPTEKRADLYIGLASGEIGLSDKGVPNPFAQLRAAERIDALCGIHAEPPKDNASPAAQVPLFALPAGTRVAIQLGQPTKRDPAGE